MSLHDLLREIIAHIPFPSEDKRHQVLAAVAEHEREHQAAAVDPSPGPGEMTPGGAGSTPGAAPTEAPAPDPSTGGTVPPQGL